MDSGKVLSRKCDFAVKSLFKNELLSHFEISIEDDLEQIHPNGICSGCTFSTLKQLTKTVYVEDGEHEMVD